MPPQDTNTISPESFKSTKKSIWKKALYVLIASIILLVGFNFITGGYGLIIIVETVKIPFRELTEAIYHSPKIEEYAIVDHQMSSPQFSPKGPFVVFVEKLQTQYREGDYGGYRTGLFNFESKETLILAPENRIPENSSLFSPNGKYLIYAVARKDGEYFLKNDYGSWRNLKGFDLYVRDLASNKSILVSSEKYPLWIGNSDSGENSFGWLNDNKIFYMCADDKEQPFPSHCMKNIKENSFEIIPANKYNPTVPKEIANAPKHESLADYPLDVAPPSPSGKITLIEECKFRVYDGCGVPAVSIRENGEEKFLYNSKETSYLLRWGYDGHLYGLQRMGTQTKIYKLY